MRHRYISVLLLAWAVTPCLALLAAPAHAEADEAKSLLAAIAAARKDKERAGLTQAVERVPPVFAATDDAGTRKKLLAALGKVLKDKKAIGARSAAAKALGEVDDKAAAWKVLSKAIPKPKAKDVAAHETEAIRAAAALSQDAAIAPLLQLMQKGKSRIAAREAIIALGTYGRSKKRTSVLEALLETTSRLDAAAQAAAKNPKGGSGGRAWEELGPSLIASLNSLTGQTHVTADAWMAAAKEHKKKLDGLFATPAD